MRLWENRWPFPTVPCPACWHSLQHQESGEGSKHSLHQKNKPRQNSRARAGASCEHHTEPCQLHGGLRELEPGWGTKGTVWPARTETSEHPRSDPQEELITGPGTLLPPVQWLPRISPFVLGSLQPARHSSWRLGPSRPASTLKALLT